MKHKFIVLLLFCIIISSGYGNKVHATTTDPKVPQSFLHPYPCEFKAKVIPKEKAVILILKKTRSLKLPGPADL